MIFIDASAMIALILGEPDADDLAIGLHAILSEAVRLFRLGKLLPV